MENSFFGRLHSIEQKIKTLNNNIMNYRKSSYTIATCVDEEQKQYMLIHGYTGAIDVVDIEIKEYLTKNRILTIDSFPYSKELFNKLVSRGYITSKSKEEERSYVKNVAKVLHKRDKHSLKVFTLLVTYDCNFQCPYCFEKDVMQRNDENLHLVMSKEMADKAFEAMLKIEPEERLRKKVINLFGGEPLLKENKEIVKYMVEKGKEYGFVFGVTSNGYDLNHYEDLLKEGYIQSVQVTIDGTKAIHDSRRVHSIYTASFDKIIDNIKMALNNGVTIGVRINVDNGNLGEIVKLENFFEEEGLFSFEKFSAYAEYISGEVNFNPESYLNKKETDINYKDFLDLFTASDMKILYKHLVYNNLRNAVHNKTSLRFFPCHCSAQSSSYIFDPFGNIYSCLEVVGNKKEIIGNYINNTIWTKEKDKWFNRDIGTVNKCSKCKYALICGGGCLAKAIERGKDMEPYCANFPMTLRYFVRKIYSHLKDGSLTNV